MQINSSQGSEPVRRLGETATPRKARAVEDRASFSGAERLRSAFEETPDVRASEVARAKGLIGDVNYPPIEGVRRIAALLATSFSEATEA